eukprot:Skav235831  [mRNA]  locus=scaffold1931:222076:230114:- [translate_table: standard]
MERDSGSFRDLIFDGSPANYREFRRKTILAVAGLEERHIHLAGPRLLTRLQGEAYRATEHIPVQELRKHDGWLVVLRALDKHYAFLPETELHEAIDSFLFDLRKRPNEGATQFASRFKTALARVQTLIAQDRAVDRSKKRRTSEQGGSVAGPETPMASSVDHSGDEDEDDGKKTPSAASEKEGADTPAASPEDAKSARSRASSVDGGERKKKGPGSEKSSRGTHAGDRKKEEVRMAQMLGTVEVGHTKAGPIFPSTVLGHLFMRKYGLSREQRAQVIRSTGGSSKFHEVERILRASDFDESRSRADERRQRHPPPPPRHPRRDTMMLQQEAHAMEDDSSSIQEPFTSGSGSDDAMAMETEDAGDEEETMTDRELQEVYEMKEKSKKDFKKSYKTYRESRRKVKEIKKARQPYYPVVAIPPQDSSARSSAPSTAGQMPRKADFKYDKNRSSSKPPVPKKRPGEGRPRREDANFTEASITEAFSYMVTESPIVVGQTTADRFSRLFQSLNLPSPQSCDLPPVELKGFSGDKRVTTKGLKWLVKIGSLWGTITTYVVEGSTPFLLSRRVLEGMQATLDMGKCTITSPKHSMKDVPLKRASNGHFLLPFCEVPSDFQPVDQDFTKYVSLTTAGDMPSDVDASDAHPIVIGNTHQEEHNEPNDDAPAAPVQRPDSDEQTCHREYQVDKRLKNRKQILQHIVKNTRKGIVNVDRFRQQLINLIGARAAECTHAFVAYRPRLERVPPDADTKSYHCCKVSLSTDGVLEVKPWITRPPGQERARVVQTNIALFAHIPIEPVREQPTGHVANAACLCCCEEVTPEMEIPPPPSPFIESLYEDIDWVSINPQSITSKGKSCIRRGVGGIRKVNAQLVLSRLMEEPDEVRKELEEWLGPQAHALDGPVHLIEVFTDHAPLARKTHKLTGQSSIILGIQHGQDFNKLRDRRMLMYLIAWCRPKHAWFSFPCGCWGPWSRFNLAKGGSSEQTVVGMRCPKTNVPVLKPTRIVTTMPELAERLSTCRCDHKHQHAHLEGKWKGHNITSWCEVYPSKFCRVVAEIIGRDVQLITRREEVLADDIFAMDEEAPVSEEENPIPDSEGAEPRPSVPQPRADKIKAIVQKLHTNTGHASVEQMLRLARRCQSSKEMQDAIKAFRCPVCEELKTPPSRRQAAMPHADRPNDIVGVDYVQVELKREDEHGKIIEEKRNVLTCVCLGTGFAQQIICPTGHALADAFHEVWARPYGLPNTIYMDPAMSNISERFQTYLGRNDVKLLLAAAESHWQLGLVEVTNRILRNMAQRVWKTTSRSIKEVIETCATTRNEQLRRCGYSPSQWFLGKDSRHVGLLRDLDEQNNIATASRSTADPDFQDGIRLREQAAIAFHEEHAKDTWRRAIAGRARPIRGPYTVGQLVYVFRKRARGLLSTRHGIWIGPGRVVGIESESGGPVPRLVWVSFNGYLYRCSPEGLRPVPEDEAEFRSLARDLSEGRLHPELEQAEQSVTTKSGQYEDLTKDHEPQEEDHELEEDLWDEPDPPEDDEPIDQGPKKIRRRFTLSDDYWRRRAEGAPPHSHHQKDEDMPQRVHLKECRLRSAEPSEDPPPKRQVIVTSDVEEQEYAPTTPADSPAQSLKDEDMSADFQSDVQQNTMPEPAETMEVPATSETDVAMEPSTAVEARDVPVPMDDDDELIIEHEEHLPVIGKHDVMEVSIDVHAEDISENQLCLWEVLEDCFTVQPPAKQRRVEVSFRKLNNEDKQRFEVAMKKEWQSWIDNKVTSICKSRGIPRERVIRARWVLVWKKSSDPDVTTKTPKARLVLVGWQDPELGKVATDSPTLKKESKNLILSICAAKRWKIWGADIKTAFLSGDPSERQLFFRPPPEIKRWMQLSDDDLFRLEKAAYGLAEAPRAWFLRLSRELAQQGLKVSQLDRCLFTLRNKKNELVGICGVHVDDLLGGGTPEMDTVLQKLRKCLPFGDFRTYTIRYTGIEIRQNPNTFAIEIGQETYINSLEPVSTKNLGSSGTPVRDPSLLRKCAGQLAWAAGATRPDKAFLASYLQGVQANATVSHIELYNKALREMKEKKIVMRFPSNIPIEDWRIICISDAGHAKRANGDSQGGYLLGLTNKLMRDRKMAPMWLVDWARKKLQRVVRSSTASETHAGNNAMDAIEFFQGLMAETLHGITPREFRRMTPKHPALLVVDSRGFYDAANKTSERFSPCTVHRLDRVLAMTQMPRKVSKQSGPLPLSEQEVTMTVGLLTRAIANHQGRKVFDRTASEDPSFSVWIRDYLDGTSQCGAMTDAAKRAHDDVDEGVASPRSSTWRMVGDFCMGSPELLSPNSDSARPSGYRAGASIPPPMPKMTGGNPISFYFPDIFLKEDKQVPIPEDCNSIDDWSETKVRMKKYEDKNFRYSSMVAAATKDGEIHSYLSWLVKTYGKDLEKPCENQATDFARFLLRINWLRDFGSKKPSGYQRSR